jgi:hypothetical protein
MKEIQVFLENFKYLNSKGKRSGILLFKNSNLTSAIQIRAIMLVERLNTLLENQSGLTAEQQFEQFLSAVSNAALEVRQHRLESDPSYLKSLGSDASNDKVTPKTLAGGKFEKCLNSGLLAIISSTDTAIEHKIKFSNLITTIMALYKPADASTAPSPK